MDLGTISKKIDQKRYKTMGDLAYDIELVVKKYVNALGHSAHVQLSTIQLPRGRNVCFRRGLGGGILERVASGGGQQAVAK